MLCKGWNLRVHREFSVSIRWNTMANAFGSSCAYHTRQTQCWAESSQLIRTGREQFLLQEESRATPNTRATLGFFFSFGMIINLWQIPQIHAAQSRLTRKKKQLSQWRNVPQRFTRFPVFFEFGNYILFHAVCTLLSRWKHAGLGSVCVNTCACAQERKVQDGSAMGWSCALLPRGFGVKHFWDLLNLTDFSFSAVDFKEIPADWNADSGLLDVWAPGSLVVFMNGSESKYLRAPGNSCWQKWGVASQQDSC